MLYAVAVCKLAMIRPNGISPFVFHGFGLGFAWKCTWVGDALRVLVGNE
jgi:hypothetical protein